MHTIPPAMHPDAGAPELTPSEEEIAEARADILASAAPGFGADDAAYARMAQVAVVLADDVEHGCDPARAIRRIRALDAAREAVAR